MKKVKSLLLFTFIVFFIIGTIGCSTEKEETSSQGQTVTKKTTIPKLASNVKGAQKGTVVQYNLGEGSLVEMDTKVPYPIQGTMGIPAGKNNPVVFILHGAHEILDVSKNAYYDGFRYLIETLADNGYLAISLNVNRAFSLEPVEGDEFKRLEAIFYDNYKALEKANNGEKIFDIDLTDKADLSKINLIGHSRSGQGSMALINELTTKGISFNSLLQVAPAYNRPLEDHNVDIPTAIILPQYDGDVISLDGQDSYNVAYRSPNRKYPITVAYLYGANHGAFNSMVNYNEAIRPDVTYMNKEKQREFLTQYAFDFLNVTNKQIGSFSDFFNDETPKRYNIDFMSSVYQPDGMKILAPSKALKGLIQKEIKLEYVEEDVFPAEDSAQPFFTPGTPDSIPLYSLQWEKKGGSMRLQLPEKNSNWQEMKTLSLYLALDSTNPKNNEKHATELSVTIKDDNGKTETIPLTSKSTPSLRYQPGKVDQLTEDYQIWTTFTPLGTELIDLSSLNNIDLSNIKEISLTTKGETGAIMIAGIDLYK
ncbi:hypothetical protein [Bacillus sp. JJ722]|uniref:hypothetical protein n=1 Tax=Bacillus sp. JJ722 TaxID=3122973 RepID=UPI002FFF7381